MSEFTLFLLAAVVTFVAMFILVPVLLGIAQMFGLYTIVEERRCRVYVLFGKVLGVLDEPGFHFLLPRLGPAKVAGCRSSTISTPSRPDFFSSPDRTPPSLPSVGSLQSAPS